MAKSAREEGPTRSAGAGSVGIIPVGVQAPPTTMVVEDDGIGGSRLVRLELLRQDPALFATLAAHQKEDPSTLVNVSRAKDRDSLHMAWLIRVTPHRVKGRMEGIGEVHLKG